MTPERRVWAFEFGFDQMLQALVGHDRSFHLAALDRALDGDQGAPPSCPALIQIRRELSLLSAGRGPR